jgi:glycerol uptake facilitator-like aquaporin
MNAARLYLAELLGTFLFMTIGYASVANFGATSPEHHPRARRLI